MSEQHEPQGDWISRAISDAPDFSSTSAITDRRNLETAKKEEFDFEAEKKFAEIDALNITSDERRQIIASRKDYASKTYKLLVGWVATVMVVILLDGLGCLDVDAGVLMALIGGVSASIVGLFAIVMGFLFPKG